LGRRVLRVDDEPSIVASRRSALEKDGYEVCWLIRQTSGVPVLMRTGGTDESDRVVGLDLGADYIAKPFGLLEVLARARAAIRRSGMTAEATVPRSDEIVMDLGRHEVTVEGRPVTLPPRQFGLLLEAIGVHERHPAPPGRGGATGPCHAVRGGADLGRGPGGRGCVRRVPRASRGAERARRRTRR
jgi:CheY-like chemotaxis protein